MPEKDYENQFIRAKISIDAIASLMIDVNSEQLEGLGILLQDLTARIEESFYYYCKYWTKPVEIPVFFILKKNKIISLFFDYSIDLFNNV